MLGKEYEKFVNCVEDMMSDGYQLCIREKLIRWEDTDIPKLLEDIKSKKKNIMKRTVKPGYILINRISGQKMSVINDDGKTIFMISAEPTIKYPSEKVWEHFEKRK